jgi:hypothetical protein
MFKKPDVTAERTRYRCCRAVHANRMLGTAECTAVLHTHVALAGEVVLALPGLGTQPSAAAQLKGWLPVVATSTSPHVGSCLQHTLRSGGPKSSLVVSYSVVEGHQMRCMPGLIGSVSAQVRLCRHNTARQLWCKCDCCTVCEASVCVQ